LAFTLEASDPDDDGLEFSAENLPDGASLEGADFSWTPGFDQSGEYEVTFNVTDGDLSDDETITITVNDVPREPYVVNEIDDLEMTEDDEQQQVANLDEVFNDDDQEDEELRYSVVSEPDHIEVVIDGNNQLQVRPDVNYNTAQDGPQAVTIRATDHTNLSAETSFNITVQPVNDPPQEFQLLTPDDDIEFRYDPDSMAVINFNWEIAQQVEWELDEVTYTLKIYLADVDEQDTLIFENIEDNSEEQSIDVIAEHFLGEGMREDALSISWSVWAMDSDFAIGAENGPFTFAIPALNVDDDLITGIPEDYYLAPNFPNPFNATTTIQFGLPLPGSIDITVWDMFGRRVAKLTSDNYSAGCHEVTWNARMISTGVYLIRLKANDFIAIRKIILVK
ncbi:MAG: Ig-like domain-containing protein, partial [Candidatus Hatepunaea meridiana]|nr:Ig-like domain-containing protein [Candidatus Hatepunaea meridiana]